MLNCQNWMLFWTLSIDCDVDWLGICNECAVVNTAENMLKYALRIYVGLLAYFSIFIHSLSVSVPVSLTHVICSLRHTLCVYDQQFLLYTLNIRCVFQFETNKQAAQQLFFANAIKTKVKVQFRNKKLLMGCLKIVHALNALVVSFNHKQLIITTDRP